MEAKHALIMGLGLFGGGVATARFLHNQGYAVKITDLRSEKDLQESLKQIEDLDFTYSLGGHRFEDFENTELVVKNPAVRPDNDYIKAARKAGAQVTSEINLFFSACKAPIYGITGSNGKTTTAFMLAAILEKAFGAQKKVWLGGNLGRSLLGELEKIKPEDCVVLELSSFQLMDLDKAQQSPVLSVITNVTPNHLDWHQDLAEYIHAKSAIFRHGGQSHRLIVNADDELSFSMGQYAPGNTFYFSLKDEMKEGKSIDVFSRGQGAFVRSGKHLTRVFSHQDLQLPGQHNVANGLAAACAAWHLGAGQESIAQALKSFKGVEHRLEYVKTLRGMRYYNDSIATTPESTIAALKSFQEPLYLFLGGSDKGLSFEALAKEIAQHKNIRGVYLQGEKVSPRLSEAIHEACKAYPNPSRSLVIEQCESFEDVIKSSYSKAGPGLVFLFSPACASFYEYAPGKSFRNFDERGRYFKELLENLEAG